MKIEESKKLYMIYINFMFGFQPQFGEEVSFIFSIYLNIFGIGLKRLETQFESEINQGKWIPLRDKIIPNKSGLAKSGLEEEEKQL